MTKCGWWKRLLRMRTSASSWWTCPAAPPIFGVLCSRMSKSVPFALRPKATWYQSCTRQRRHAVSECALDALGGVAG
jgi:hypothetical protein